MKSFVKKLVATTLLTACLFIPVLSAYVYTQGTEGIQTYDIRDEMSENF